MTRKQIEEGRLLVKTIDDYNRIMDRMQDGTHNGNITVNGVLRLQCSDVTISLSEMEQGWVREMLENRVRTLETTLDMM